ncbi:hypothetical protein [Pseudomonas psychrophila]|uniref:hypothetical protein n=1 Tax=Pseudomonas psychrophila TaxID=122355 RepID=UPI003823483F
MKLFILHPGKANYPEISAYKEHLSSSFEVSDGTLIEYNNLANKDEIIVWCIMGYYPKKIIAKYIIHDYRSLSVGKLAKIKDIIKRYKNHKPHLRIFQNQLIEHAMNFKDNIDRLYIPMGVPDWIFTLESDQTLENGTFCYIGEICRERGMDKLISAFMKHSRSEDKLILVGSPEPEIFKQFKGHEKIVFTGKLSQKQALQTVKNCTYSICTVPSRYPYCFQAPTKFLEYASLKKTIICNKSPSNYLVYNEVESNAIFTNSNSIFSENLFAELSSFEEKLITNQTYLSWPNVLEKSGVLEFIKRSEIAGK